MEIEWEGNGGEGMGGKESVQLGDCAGMVATECDRHFCMYYLAILVPAVWYHLFLPHIFSVSKRPRRF